MNKINLFKLNVLAVAIFLFALPSMASAYKIIDQTATKINATTAIYTISYEFGFLNADLWVPIVASGEGVNTSYDFAVKYNLKNKEDRSIFLDTVNSLVLSQADIVDGKYFVPKGQRYVFTLVVLQTINPAESVNDQVALNVTDLPFVIKKQDEHKKIESALSREILIDYVTPKVSF